MTASFGTRLDEVFVRSGRLCVGIDPHRFLLKAWGLPDTAAGAGAFGLAVVEATAGRAGIVKPQVAFFERFGSAGYVALEGVLAAARDAGLLVIGDAKRGEIGTSMEGYAEAWLTPGSPLEVDALTVNPYLGFGSLQPALELAEHEGKGLFVLTATSNPEGHDVQLAEDGTGTTVAALILEEIDHWNRRHHPGSTGSIGAVIGATLHPEEFGLTEVPLSSVVPILAPGFGHQGAAVADLESIYGDLAPGVIVSESRSILAAGPSGIADAVERSAAAVRSARG
ncbi:orotidine-5'-phosphate decarboxylase [Plantibacter sp. VKM Ac-2880]|uniref:orotidine-5'-phosphate decarboxylase n=1 Tax=Plantibacter sp. VKM Ac-2880 TaxID=2783827 RepID=UPI001890708E|nr:orotidine-5'-phosphate decarboxylase [Plantibacter sp. VKM Ac-2880]